MFATRPAATRNWVELIATSAPACSQTSRRAPSPSTRSALCPRRTSMPSARNRCRTASLTSGPRAASAAAPFDLRDLGCRAARKPARARSRSARRRAPAAVAAASVCSRACPTSGSRRVRDRESAAPGGRAPAAITMLFGRQGCAVPAASALRRSTGVVILAVPCDAGPRPAPGSARPSRAARRPAPHVATRSITSAKSNRAPASAMPNSFARAMCDSSFAERSSALLGERSRC